MSTKLAIERAKTNRLLAKILEIDFNAAPITPEEARILEHLDDNLNKQVNAYVQWLESEEGKEALINSANREVEIFNDIREDIRQIYRETGNNVNEVIERIYQAGEAKGYNDIRQIRVYTEASKYALQFLKDYNFELIRRASNDFVDMLQEEIFVGMASGLHPYQIAINLLNAKFEVPEGMTLTPEQRARMIARTETARAQTTGTLQAYANYGVEEIDVIPAHDKLVCKTCKDNKAHNPHPLEESIDLCPAHPNCRCAVAAHIRHNTELELQDNPKVINNTPLTYEDISGNEDIYEFKKLKKEQIPEYIPDVLANQMLKFDAKVKNKNIEYLTYINLTQKEVSKIVTDKIKDKVSNEKLLKFLSKIKFDDSYGSIHNHTSNDPFNHKDFKKALNEDYGLFTYLLVDSPDFVYIAKFKSRIGSLYHEDIICEIKKSYAKGIKQAKIKPFTSQGREIWENYINNEVLNKYIEFERIRKYE